MLHSINIFETFKRYNQLMSQDQSVNKNVTAMYKTTSKNNEEELILNVL